MENHADDIRLSTLRKYARALGRKVKLENPSKREIITTFSLRGFQLVLTGADFDTFAKLASPRSTKRRPLSNKTIHL